MEEPKFLAELPELSDLFEMPEAGPSAMLGNARAAIVNRTHRVVRERAVALRARKRTLRSLAAPMAITSALLLIVCHAVWTTISQNSFGLGELNTVSEEIEETASRLLSGQAMDSGGPVYILLMWFLPISLVAIVTLLVRRQRGRYDDEVTR